MVTRRCVGRALHITALLLVAALAISAARADGDGDGDDAVARDASDSDGGDAYAPAAASRGTRNCVTEAALQAMEAMEGVGSARERMRLYRRVLDAERCAQRVVPVFVTINDNQFSALVAAALNVSCARLNASDVIAALTAGRNDQLNDAFVRLHTAPAPAPALSGTGGGVRSEEEEDAGAANSGGPERGLAEAKVFGAVERSPCVQWQALVAELRADRADERAGADPSRMPVLAALAMEQRMRLQDTAAAKAKAADRARAKAAADAAVSAEQRAADRERTRQFGLLNAAGAAVDVLKAKALAEGNAGAKAGAQAMVQTAATATAKAKAKAKASAAAGVESRVLAKATSGAAVRNADRANAAIDLASKSNAQQTSASAAAGLSATKDGAKDSAKDGGLWWMEQEPWFLPPPDEWGPMPVQMYTHFWHKPRYNNDRYTSYNPLASRPDDYNSHLPVAKRPRATLTRQLEYDDYVDRYYAHTHYNPSGDPNWQVGTNTHYTNAAYFGLGGLNEGHARQLAKGSANNYSPLFSANANSYYHFHNFASPTSASAGLYNGGINSFLQTDQRVRRRRVVAPAVARAVARDSATHFVSSARVSYRRPSAPGAPAVAAAADG